MHSKLIAFVTASLLIASGSVLKASVQLHIGDTVDATLTQSFSIMGTGATTLMLYNSVNTLEETWNSSQGGLLGWTNVKVNGRSAPDFRTACIEVLQNVYWGGVAHWTIVDLANAPKPNVLNGLTSGMGDAAANLIQALYNDHYEDAEASNTNAGAYQIAVWKLEYDGANVVTGPNFSSGRLRASVTPEVSLAMSWLSELSGNSGTSHTGVVALTSDTFQDQLYGSAPEPASWMVWAMLAGIVGVCLNKRRRDRMRPVSMRDAAC